MRELLFLFSIFNSCALNRDTISHCLSYWKSYTSVSIQLTKSKNESKYVFVPQNLPKVQSFLLTWKFKISCITCRFCNCQSKKSNAGFRPSFIHLLNPKSGPVQMFFLNWGYRKKHWVILVLRTGELCCRFWRARLSSALL